MLALTKAAYNGMRFDAPPEAEAVGQVIMALYQGVSWIALNAVWAPLYWLWTLTPPGAPVHEKLLPHFAAAGMLGLGMAAWKSRFRLQNGLYGRARFASPRSLRKAGMLEDGGRFLGRVRGRDIAIHGEGHTLTIAAQGGGKTTSLVIPALLTYRGTVVVTDPKAAIIAQTQRDRAIIGKVVRLSPWSESLKADPAFGIDIGDDGFNPLGLVSLTDDGRAAATLIAALLLPDMPGEDSYWNKEGRELLEWGMLFLAANFPAADCTLPRLRELLYDSAGLLDAMKLYAEGNGQARGHEVLAPGASKLVGLSVLGAGGQLAGILGAAASALKIYTAGTPLARHVSRDGLRLADLKSGDVKTLYLVCPPDHLIGDDRKWLNLVLALICQEIGKPGAARETVLLVDEFPALGYLPNLAGALEQFREAGLRAHLFAQNVGQILTIYGADGMRRFWGACENKQFFRITDPEAARLLSDWLGQRTVKQFSANHRGEISSSLVGIPLVRPEELLKLPGNRQIIMRSGSGLDPIRAEVFPYFRRAEWAARVDANPYRKR